MYFEYFGLQRPPFRITPDTDLFYAGAERGEILDALVYAIDSGEALTKVVGEVGSGKTMLCRMLEQKLAGNIEVVYLANPSLAPEQVLHAIAFELGLPVQPQDDRLLVLKTLQDYLLQMHAENRQVVVFVEEAQGMPLATLEEIRLLSNLETKQHKLLQVVLFGQPELDEGLNAKHVRQIRERITNSFYLPVLQRREVRDYLMFRLHLVGYRGAEIFSPLATRLIAAVSKGLMRRINIIADKAMLAAYADDSKLITVRHVYRAWRESEFKPQGVSLRPLVLAMPWFILTVLLALWLASGTAPGPAQAEEVRFVAAAQTVTPQPVTTPVSTAPPPENVRPEPAPLSVLEQRLAATQARLDARQAQGYTIQVLLAQAEDTRAIERFMHKVDEPGIRDQFFLYHTKINEKEMISVTFGDYENYSDAVAALEQLPESLRRYQPFLRNVSSLVAETKAAVGRNAQES